MPEADDGDDESVGISDPVGWALVCIIILSFGIIPAAIVIWPPTFVPYRDAYLALSLVPGLILGLTAIWTAIRFRR